MRFQFNSVQVPLTFFKGLILCFSGMTDLIGRIIAEQQKVHPSEVLYVLHIR